MELRQLYIEYNSVYLPSYIDTEFKTIQSYVKKSFALIRWPNGKPCALVNMWLTDIGTATTGQTLKQYCANITPYVRYCYDENMKLESFTDSHMYKLVKVLCFERKPNTARRHEFKRNNNQTRAIINTVIRFLIWYQESFFGPDYRKIIGKTNDSPQVTIHLKKNSKTGALYQTHMSSPPAVAAEDDVHAMPDDYIERIENEIFRKNNLDELNPKARTKFIGNPTLFLAQSEYLYSRRMFMNWVMKRTGLRPSELVDIPLHLNNDVTGTCKLSIPTKKKRTDNPAPRQFKLNPSDCERVVRYLDERKEFLDALKSVGLKPSHRNAFFLTASGTPLNTQSMTKDFSRVARDAGLTNLKVCFSMYRHRFITKEILIHLKQLLKTNNPHRDLVTEAVIKSVCERIRRKVGHGSKESLWHYFDSAFDELELWGGVDEALASYDVIESLSDEMAQLRRIASNGQGQGDVESQLEAIAEQLRAIRSGLGHPNF